MLSTLDEPTQATSFSLTFSEFTSICAEPSTDVAAFGIADDLPDPGFVLQARRLALQSPTAGALARLAKAELDAGNRVSSLGAARQVLDAPGRGADAAALIVATDVAMLCGDVELATRILASAESPQARRATAVRAAALAAERNDIDHAIELLDSSWTTSDPCTWELRGLLQLKTSDFSGAINSLRKAIQAEVCSPDAHTNLAYAYASVGSMGKALRSAKTAFALAPSSRVAGVNLAAIYDIGQQHKAAISVIDRLLHFYPEDPHLHFGHAELTARVVGVGRALDELRRVRYSEWFRNVGDRHHAELDSLVAMFRLHKGEITRHEAFRVVLNASARADYRSEQIARQLGEVAGGFSEADDLEVAISLFAGHVDAADLFSARVTLASLRRDLSSARELLDEWAVADPGNPNVWATGSLVSLHDLDFEQASRWAREGLRRFPSHPILLNNLAFALALGGHPAEARRIPQAEPNSVMSQATSAAIDMAAGDIAGGRAKYSVIADSLRASSPLWQRVVLIYRAFTTYVITGRVVDTDDLILTDDLRDEASICQLVESLRDAADAPLELDRPRADSTIIVLSSPSTPDNDNARPRRSSQQGEPIMPSNNSRHVTQRPDGRWQVIAPGASKASAIADTQRDAISRGREIVHNAGGGELRIHGRDGRIRDADTIPPARDPNPPRDKR